MMELSATFSKSNSFEEYAAWMTTITLGKNHAHPEKSLQFVERPTGSTCTYGDRASVSANPTLAHRVIFFQYLPGYDEYLLDTGDTSGLSASLSIFGYLGTYSITNSWISTQVIQEEEEPETIHADTSQGLSFRDLVNVLDRMGTDREQDLHSHDPFMGYNQYISIDPNIAFGKPCIINTRISVEFILDLLALDWTIYDVLENYPQLTREQIRAVIDFARKRIHYDYSQK